MAALDDHTVMSTLLQQARVCLAQGQPSQALSLVLAAVRHQRGETGVFEVLNETRVAHGLQRLAVPTDTYGTQLPGGSSHSAPRLHRAAAGAHQPQPHEMMEDEDGPALLGHDAQDGLQQLDPADAVETMFRNLSMQHQTATAAAAPAAAHSNWNAGFAQQQQHHHHHHDHHHHSHQHHAHQHYGAAQPSFSSSSSFGGAALSAGQFGWPGAPPPVSQADLSYDGAPMRANLTYPSLRTVLPALSGAAHSTTSLELVHEPASAASANGTDTDAAAASAPLLSLQGRDEILDYAYDDTRTNVICSQCGALIPKTRFAAHLQYWCQNQE